MCGQAFSSNHPCELVLELRLELGLRWYIRVTVGIVSVFSDDPSCLEMHCVDEHPRSYRRTDLCVRVRRSHKGR